MKAVRYLKGSRGKGILIVFQLKEMLRTWLHGWMQATLGQRLESQSGLSIVWGGSTTVWRSSRQTVSTLSTAEAELISATLVWQIVEGLRYLLSDFGIEIPKVKVMIDNQAALTIAMCGANRHTRYFEVRVHRLHEEHQHGRAEPLHCPTQDMLGLILVLN